MAAQGKKGDIKYQAQDILSRRDHSEFELRQKLAKKGFSAAAINEVITWLQTKKLVNDAAFARRYVESLIRSRAVGRRYLSHKLVEKRVNKEAAQAAITELITDEVEKDLAIRAAAAWQRQHAKYAADKL